MATLTSILQLLLLQMILFMRYSVNGLTCASPSENLLSVTLIGMNDCNRYTTWKFHTLKIRYKSQSTGLLDNKQLITNNTLFQEDGEISVQIVPYTQDPPQRCLSDAFFRSGFRPLLSIFEDTTIPIKVNELTIELPNKCDIEISSTILEGVNNVRNIHLIVPNGTLTLNETLFAAISNQPTLLSIYNATVVDGKTSSSEALQTTNEFSLQLENVEVIRSSILLYFLKSTPSVTFKSETGTSTDCECSWIQELGQDKVSQFFSDRVSCSSGSEKNLMGKTLTIALTECQTSDGNDMSTTEESSATVPLPPSTAEQKSRGDEDQTTVTSKPGKPKVATSSTMVLTVVALAAVLCVVILAVLVGLACRRRTANQQSRNETTIKYGPIQAKDKQQHQQQQGKHVENGYYAE